MSLDFIIGEENMAQQKTIALAVAGAMALATISPAVASAAGQHGPTPYYQTQHRDHDRWDRRDVVDGYERRAEQEYRRDLAAERCWREQQWRYEHRNRNDNSTRNAAFAFVAGDVIGPIVQDSRGERRQYYRDNQTGRYYYYNYDRNAYAWDYNYRPGYYR